MKVSIDTSGPHGGDRVVVIVYLSGGQEMILNVDEVTDHERVTGHNIRLAHQRSNTVDRHDGLTNLGWGLVDSEGGLHQR